VVNIAPPDVALGLWLADDVFVPRATPGVRGGVDCERAPVGDHSLAAAEGVLVESRDVEVPVDFALGVDAVGFEVAHWSPSYKLDGE
jgi:hypothetical protein